MCKRIDITGQRYGNLTVVNEAAQKGKERRWNCICDCGEETTVAMTSLRSGNTQSCGCIKPINISKANSNDLTGQRFGKLTVIKRSEDSRYPNYSFWECKCDCGEIKVVVNGNLKSGLTKSCGCIRRKITKKKCLKEMLEIYRNQGVIEENHLQLLLPFPIFEMLEKFKTDNLEVLWKEVSRADWEDVKKQYLGVKKK